MIPSFVPGRSAVHVEDAKARVGEQAELAVAGNRMPRAEAAVDDDAGWFVAVGEIFGGIDDIPGDRRCNVIARRVRIAGVDAYVTGRMAVVELHVTRIEPQAVHVGHQFPPASSRPTRVRRRDGVPTPTGAAHVHWRTTRDPAAGQQVPERFADAQYRCLLRHAASLRARTARENWAGTESARTGPGFSRSVAGTACAAGR